MKFVQLLGLVAPLLGIARAASTFSPARPPSIPLAVKSPYMNTILGGGNLAGTWPKFWAGAITGWAGIVRVDGNSYAWLGAPRDVPVATQTAFEYTSTRSRFTFNVNNAVQLTVTFLSPVTPNDFKRASLPFTYLDVAVVSLDGANHDVQLYSDIAAEFVSGDRNANAQWNYGSIPGGKASAFTRKRKSAATSGIAYHQVFRQQQLLFSETNDQANWGNWYYVTSDTAALTHQSGADTDVRGQFTGHGALSGTADSEYRPINQRYPVFGFAIALGSVGKSSVSTLFGLSLNQQQAIQFEGAKNSIQPVPSLWTSYFRDDLEAVSFFYNDYNTAQNLADKFDKQIATDSTAAAGQNYLTITSLAVRQSFAGVQLCGTIDTPYVFLKEISSDGNVNTVDVIFPFHPILVYTNPTLLKLLLDPLFINQESGNWPEQFSIHDIGGSYPNATGHNDGNDEKQPLEECGDMLIMTLAYAQRTGDNAYLSKHYNILKQWNGYLVEKALVPEDQISTDDFAGSLINQTNLALKGIIGIQAMAQIASRTGNTADATNFTNIAHSYIDQWQQLGIAHNANPPHATLAYGQEDTHGLLYNLYADRLLGLGLVPQSVYDIQSNFYPTVQNKYGVPLDTRHSYTKDDWEMFCAAVAAPATRSMFVDSVTRWINETPATGAFPDWFDTINAQAESFSARPVQGGVFALLALNSAPKS